MAPSKLTIQMMKRIYTLSKERNSPSEIRRIISREFKKVSTTFIHYVLRDIENNKFIFKRKCKCCNGSGNEELNVCNKFLICNMFDENTNYCMNTLQCKSVECQYYNNNGT